MLLFARLDGLCALGLSSLCAPQVHPRDSVPILGSVLLLRREGMLMVVVAKVY